ncbi:MAG: NAD(P)-dependent oxidoreductase [Phycisphaerae bacterium]
MKTIFVTGAEGFCGRHTVTFLKQKGYDVVGGVRNRARKLAYERRHGKALVCDVSDAISSARAIASVKPDAVIHLASTSRAGEAASDPLTAYQTIVSGWANVLDGVRRAVPRARVVLASAWEVYGSSFQADQPIDESATCRPVATFGEMKCSAEAIAATYFKNYHLNLSIVRPFNMVGAGQSEQFFFGAVAKRVVEWDAATGGNELRLPDLAFRRDVLHVADVVTALEKVTQSGKPNETYNICSGLARTVRDLVQGIANAAGRSLTLSDLQPATPGTTPFSCGRNQKLRELGWQPTNSVDQGIQELVSGYATPANSPAATTA